MAIEPLVNVGELVREDGENFSVHGRVYIDPSIFAMEMERIFHRTWVYLGHESEVAEPGDYKTTYIGLQPVIMTRDADDGQVYVLYNRCRHRGATVCQYEYGNANYFRCAYHGWTYRNRGDLVSVPMKEGYGPRFDTTELGLMRVPRVTSYRGFVFASLATRGPSLDEHLGNVRSFIDKFIDQWPEGELDLRAGNQKYGFNGNWKLQLENTVDNYHFPLVHRTMVELRHRRTGDWYNPNTMERKQWDLGNGHAAFEAGLGAVHFVVFPNLALLGLQVRVIRPIAADRTEVTLYATVLKGAPPELNAARLREHEDGFGPAGFIGPDDQEVAMTRVPAGLRADRSNPWVQASRGLHTETVEAGGIRSSHISHEVTYRGIYRGWKRLMAAE